MSSKIPTKLVSALEERFRKNFVDKVYEYLEDFFPGTHDYFEYEQIVATIELGIAKAQNYNIHGKNDICNFVFLMFTFLGSHFDVDPLFPWAKNTLNTSKVKSQPTLIATEKVEALWQEQQQISSSLFADGSKYLSNLIQTLRSKALLEPFSDYQQSLTDRVHQRLHQYYPEKYSLFPMKNIDSLIDEGFLLCSNYNIKQENEVCWYISLMFIFGSRFDIDPKYPVLSYLQQKKSLKEGELTEYLKEMVNQYLKNKIKSIRGLNTQQKESA